MKKTLVYYPQDEMHTSLLAITKGCSHNACSFCSMYKDIDYEPVDMAEIKYQLMNSYEYTERVFLTGADPLSIGFERMEKILSLIREELPYCGCVAAYASVSNLKAYSLEEIERLHQLGLRLLYIGFETGSDQLLEKIDKGHTREEAIEVGKKLNQAKLQFNSIFMYGLAGKGQGPANALSTAQLLSQFDSAKLISMGLLVFHGTKLSEDLDRGLFMEASREEKLEELEILLENLDREKSFEIDTSHPSNIIKIRASWPEDREEVLRKIDSYREIVRLN